MSLKIQNSSLKIIEDFSIDSGKTSELVKTLFSFGEPERTVIILNENRELKESDQKAWETLHDKNKMTKRAGSNLPWLQFLSYNSLRAHDLFYGRRIIILESAAKNLNDFYNSEKKIPGEEIAQ